MDTITPYRIEVPDADLDDLRDRLARTRWPAQPAGPGWERGIPLGELQPLADYWRDGFDWRAQEAALNRIPQFTTEIDGQPIHFLHVTSPEPGALPLVMTHGWPSTFTEFLDVLGPLSDPAAHGGDPADAFHLVVPSLPGFAFSSPATTTGWTTRKVAEAWAELMRRLGYERYGASGGDVGAGVSPDLGRVAPDQVAGVHVNAATAGFMPFPPVDEAELAELNDVERRRVERIETFMRDNFAYAQLQSTRPNTLGYLVSDSPMAQLAWILDFGGQPRELDRDRVLTNASLYWLTGTGGSAAAIYYEDAHSGAGWGPPERLEVPTGVAVFAEDIAIRRYAEPHHNIVHWTDFDTGGHFPGIDAPDLLTGDLRAFFRPLR
jgi:pimeloyl-ACP methyl ester carboxylesterase